MPALKHYADVVYLPVEKHLQWHPHETIAIITQCRYLTFIEQLASGISWPGIVWPSCPDILDMSWLPGIMCPSCPSILLLINYKKEKQKNHPYQMEVELKRLGNPVNLHSRSYKYTPTMLAIRGFEMCYMYVCSTIDIHPHICEHSFNRYTRMRNRLMRDPLLCLTSVSSPNN